MNEIIPGIYRLKIPMPRTNVLLDTNNVYLLKSSGGHMLIDCGWNTAEAYETLVKEVQEAGAKLEEVSNVLVTHSHPDHYGLAARIRESTGARVYLHYLDKAVLTERYLDTRPYLALIQDWFTRNGVPPLLIRFMMRISTAMVKNPNPAPPDFELKGGETFTGDGFRLRVIPSPGHSPGQVCYYDDVHRLLFSGDHILPHTVPHIGLWPNEARSPLDDYLDSLEQIEKLDIEMALPGHENPFARVKPRIENIIAHHEQRDRDIMKQMTAGPQTAFEIASGVPWSIDMGGLAFAELNAFDQRLAIVETLAHLRHLEHRGAVTIFEENDRVRFKMR